MKNKMYQVVGKKSGDLWFQFYDLKEAIKCNNSHDETKIISFDYEDVTPVEAKPLDWTKSLKVRTKGNYVYIRNGDAVRVIGKLSSGDYVVEGRVASVYTVSSNGKFLGLDATLEEDKEI